MGINPIILLVGHSLHREHLLVGPNEDLACGSLHLLQHQLKPLSSRFCFEGSEINCLDCFLYGVNCRSSLTILCIEDLEILASFASFLTLLSGFRFIFFTAETTFLVRIELFLHGIGLLEVMQLTL